MISWILAPSANKLTSYDSSTEMDQRTVLGRLPCFLHWRIWKFAGKVHLRRGVAVEIDSPACQLDPWIDKRLT